MRTGERSLVARREAEGRALGRSLELVPPAGVHGLEPSLSVPPYTESLDQLTGLPTRGPFLDQVWRAIESLKRNPATRFAVLVIDLDRFRVVRERFGRSTSDRILMDVARRLERSLRPSDILARLDDNQFAILVASAGSVNAASRVASRVVSEIARPFDLPGSEVVASASVGISIATPACGGPSEVMREAELAMHRAKAAGGSQYAIFELALHARAVQHLAIENGLRLALERGELVAYYQPIHAIDTGQISGFEALVRWNHPEHGLVQPDAFIGIAEESDVIHAVDDWMVREACRQLGRWRREIPAAASITVSVNLSSKEFRRPDLVERIEAALANASLDPSALRLEVTESALLDSSPEAAATLARVGEFGTKLLIDDFGTGYSSLSYLHRYPFDMLKIDRSFISGETADTIRTAEIVRAVVLLAHTLGLGVVAEGVETAAALEALRTMGCEYGQGFYFHPPVDARRAGALIVGGTKE
jgi:diguanylate cyclase (GGDEF)-like protein